MTTRESSTQSLIKNKVQDGRYWRHRLLSQSTEKIRVACYCAAVLSLATNMASSPAAAQFACTVTAIDSTCTNTGNATTLKVNVASGTNQNATTTNSGTAVGFASFTSGGGNATVTNSGTNSAFGLFAQTSFGGNATITNTGSNSGGFTAITAGDNSSITLTNTGSNTIGSNNNGGIGAFTSGVNSSITITNSGTNTLGINAATQGANSGITLTNSGSNTGGLSVGTIGLASDVTVVNSGSNSNGMFANSSVSGNATLINSGSNDRGMGATAIIGNATVINSGTTSGGVTAFVAVNGNATVINSGIATGTPGFPNAPTVVALTNNGTAVLTNILGGRVIGGIEVIGNASIVNFQGGNWLYTIATLGNAPIVNANGAPFMVSNNQVAVLDPTTFALADRSLMNFTGGISQTLQDRFAGMTAGTGGSTALSFAGSSSSPLADQAQAAFSGIPSVAMSYASSASRPIIGKAAPPAPVSVYDTTVWASGFGGERRQRADGLVLAATDGGFGGAMGVDRIVNSNLRVGVFVGAGTGREEVELGVQTIDATYVFGGGYGRFDWASQYLDFALYGGGIDNKSTRQVANNLAPNGLELATASYGGWFISPEITYGYRIPVNGFTVTPRVRLRYVGGELDGYSESGSAQNLSVAGRAINDIEERGELEFSMVNGPMKASSTIGVIGLERLGNPTINTVLLGQNLAFVTPGQASAVGGVFGMRLEYRLAANAGLFVAGEGTLMSDKSDSFAATGGAKLSF